MQVAELKIDRKEARERYREYRDNRHYSDQADAEIKRAYQAIARGRMVIQALESIKQAALNSEGFPKLAIARADTKLAYLRMWSDGSCRMASDRSRLWSGGAADRTFSWPSDTFPHIQRDHKNGEREAIVPIVPAKLRPAAAQKNYHILWEAEWTRIVPRDPLLLRRLGKGDLWLVLAHWDLTEVERAALATRVHAA